MNSIYTPLVHTIRSFNRFYTNILGLLEHHMFDSDFSLSEVRVLYEIGHMENCTSKKLIEELRIDSGYLSRIIKRLDKQELTYRVQSTEDGRLYYLYLTDNGKESLSKLNDRSDQQIYQMIVQLEEQNQKRLIEGMQAIESALSRDSVSRKEKINLRYELKPGDVGQLIHLHGWIYAQECGYNHVFEGYVCKTLSNFFENYSPQKDRFWFAEADGEMIGAIAIVGHSAEKAQLRWFILHPEFRGIGLGNKLLNEAMQYCREKGYKNLFLVTTEDQKTAVKMYLKAGFRKVAAHENHAWGKDLIEQTFELNLP
ncbi:bifunctional helix-turn-helix transcriptional regulator/GNAT family N-acetyltransferase [Desulfosporosinus lacus]|uniref:Transcriptional regulator, MarR family with acetyltransferase activity n=1 Tax=Desulfosporosinus lacus DSM 15449 TaxID=1121420 RepID=A0A1M5ZSW3_9FIRM|nr:bifunctional helix-turn-helix transcriptional regulator/GNAT family N-acetyltransferase [Desulfosporosinus lacus]SHI27302.1 transcriptional regulator, MarR family with acetyltransferase activity [Desulfosporosinus lacus DSM 15449]